MHAYEERTTVVADEGLLAVNPVIRLHRNEDEFVPWQISVYT